jgi:hypothetical protein
MRQILFILFISSTLISTIKCITKNKRRVLIESDFAEGNISGDTILNGRIKYYDTLSNKLSWEADYDKSILHGQETEYYHNGKIKAQGNFRDGKKNGVVKFFDSTGAILSEQFYYYGLLAGPSTDFKNGEPSEYYFNSLDNIPLFYLNYDSIVGKEIETIQHRFFFYNVYDKSDIITHSNPRREFLLYLISPPKFRFSYSLCIIKDKFEIVEEIKTFDNSKVWDTFAIDKTTLKMSEQFAIRLTVNDDINKRAIEMFKRIE